MLCWSVDCILFLELTLLPSTLQWYKDCWPGLPREFLSTVVAQSCPLSCRIGFTEVAQQSIVLSDPQGPFAMTQEVQGLPAADHWSLPSGSRARLCFLSWYHQHFGKGIHISQTSLARGARPAVRSLSPLSHFGSRVAHRKLTPLLGPGLLWECHRERVAMCLRVVTTC